MKDVKTQKKMMVSELNSYLLEYSVIGFDGKTYLVDLDRKTCTCNCFDIDRYPCIHALAANRKKKNGKIPLHDLCSKYYWVEQWALAYSKTIYPVPHHTQWKVPDEIREMYALLHHMSRKKGETKQLGTHQLENTVVVVGGENLVILGKVQVKRPQVRVKEAMDLVKEREDRVNVGEDRVIEGEDQVKEEEVCLVGWGMVMVNNYMLVLLFMNCLVMCI